MERYLTIDQNYLYIPVKPGKEERYFDIYILDEGGKDLFTGVKIPYRF
ncbi:MAG: hypothetical protein MJ097_01545 [Dorea sp.]|nr:hypothetical protein [Dorea sp.]